MSSPPPLSRHQTIRIARYTRRLDFLLGCLEALPDRRKPLTRALAGDFRRTLYEGRALLGLGRTRHLDRTRQGVEFFLESILVSTRLTDLKPPQQKAFRRPARKTYPPQSAPW